MDLPFIVVVGVCGAALKGNVPIVDLLLLGHGVPQLEAVDVDPSQDTHSLLS